MKKVKKVVAKTEKKKTLSNGAKLSATKKTYKKDGVLYNSEGKPIMKEPKSTGRDKTKWQKGVSGNPKGDTAKMKARRSITPETLKQILEEVFTSTKNDILAKLRNPNTPLGEAIIHKAALDALNWGNYDKLERMLERVVGKIPQEVNITSKNVNQNLDLSDLNKLPKDVMNEIMKKVEESI